MSPSYTQRKKIITVWLGEQYSIHFGTGYGFSKFTPGNESSIIVMEANEW